jgi:very-short-patch-repair endonuclease
LIVELDGNVHNDPIQSEYDSRRTVWLERMGYRVIRFENKVVFHDMVNVLAEIARNFGWSM